LIVFDVGIICIDHDPISTYEPWNDQLLDQLRGKWENNLVLTMRVEVDENYKTPKDDSAGSIVKMFDDPEPESKPVPNGEVVISLYRIEGTINTEGDPAPKYVMVQVHKGDHNRYKDAKKTMVVYDIVKNVTGEDWVNANHTKFKDQLQVFNQIRGSYLKLDGTANITTVLPPARAKPEDVAALMKLAESP
jgi:hypothetical protein